MLASGTSAGASGSSATATGCPWKFPPESTSSSSGNTMGLSETAFASTSRTPRTNRSTSRVAPFTCGEQRSESASCTRCVLSRCEATIGLPSSSRRRFDAEATTPGCGRSAVSRWSNTRSAPGAAGGGEEPDREHPLRAVDEGEALLGLELERFEPGRTQEVARGPSRAIHQQLAAADEREREVRERRQVTGRAKRALFWHDGDQVPIQHLDHPLDDLGSDARTPARAAGRA